MASDPLALMFVIAIRCSTLVALQDEIVSSSMTTNVAFEAVSDNKDEADNIVELRACSDNHRCGKVLDNAGTKMEYFGCNAKCKMANNSVSPKEVKQCRDSTCVECYTQNEKCDHDNPDQCCKYKVQYKGENFLFKPLCTDDKICEEFCWPEGKKCDPKNYKCCKKGDNCLLVAPPDTYSCVSRNSSDPATICTLNPFKDQFECRNYHGVRTNNYNFCKCPPTTNMTTGFGNCDANKNCVSCNITGGICKTEKECCRSYQVQVQCVNGKCDVCIPTKKSPETYYDYNCDNAKCCDSTKNCNDKYSTICK